MSFKGFFSVLSSVGHFVRRSGTILAILIEGYKMYVRMKMFAMFQQNYMTVLKMADNLLVSVLLV